MKTPRLSISNYLADQTYSGIKDKKLIKDMAAYLLETGRTNDLSSILRDVQLNWAQRGRVEVVVTSAHKIDQTTKQSIEAIVKKSYTGAKQVVINEAIDTSLLGGLRITTADKELDLSLSSQLNKFKALTMKA